MSGVTHHEQQMLKEPLRDGSKSSVVRVTEVGPVCFSLFLQSPLVDHENWHLQEQLRTF